MKYRVGRTRVSLWISGAVAAGSILAAPHSAAALATCNLLVDDRGDDAIIGHDRGRYSTRSLDLVSADVATTSSHIVAVIRVDRLSALEPAAPTGSGYKFRFSVGKLSLELEANRTPLEQRFRAYLTGLPAPGLASGRAQLDDPDGVFDLTTSEIRMVLPLTALPPSARITRGQLIGQLSVMSSREVGSPNRVFPAMSGSSADFGRSAKTYRAGAASCVANRAP